MNDRLSKFNSLLPEDINDGDYYLEINRPIEKYTMVASDENGPFILNSDDLAKLKEEAIGTYQWFDTKIYDLDSMTVVFEQQHRTESFVV